MHFLNIKNILIILSSLLIVSILITIFNYFDFISNHVLNVLEFILLIITFFIGGFLTGENSPKKGWLEGFKFSLVFIILFIFLNIFIYHNLKISTFLYYLILIISSIFGSMIGIFVKKS